MTTKAEWRAILTEMCELAGVRGQETDAIADELFNNGYHVSKTTVMSDEPINREHSRKLFRAGKQD